MVPGSSVQASRSRETSLFDTCGDDAHPICNLPLVESVQGFSRHSNICKMLSDPCGCPSQR
eukprot:4069413-Amphidinium_carterae.3